MLGYWRVISIAGTPKDKAFNLATQVDAFAVGTVWCQLAAGSKPMSFFRMGWWGVWCGCDDVEVDGVGKGGEVSS